MLTSTVLPSTGSPQKVRGEDGLCAVPPRHQFSCTWPPKKSPLHLLSPNPLYPEPAAPNPFPLPRAGRSGCPRTMRVSGIQTRGPLGARRTGTGIGRTVHVRDSFGPHGPGARLPGSTVWEGGERTHALLSSGMFIF
jgi:hypothetical protein